jgi:hypothetical protein
MLQSILQTDNNNNITILYDNRIDIIKVVPVIVINFTLLYYVYQ